MENLCNAGDKHTRPKASLSCSRASTSVEEILEKLYDAPPVQVSPLRRTAFDPQHGKHVNSLACWGLWEGAEDFGRNGEKEDP